MATLNAETLQPETSTRLQGKALFLARAGWAILAAVCLSFWVPSIILYGGIFYYPGLPWIQGSPYANVIPELIPFWWILHFLLYALLAVFIFWRKSDDKMVLLASATLLAIGTSNGATTEFWFVEREPILLWLPALVEFLAVVFLLIFFSRFPDGKFFPKWVSMPIWGFISMTGLGFLLRVINTVLEINSIPILKLPDQVTLVLQTALYSTIFISFVASISGQIYRYRHISAPSQRQQTKWIVWGLIVMVLMYVSIAIGSLFIEIIDYYFPFPNVTTMWSVFYSAVQYNNGLIFFFIPFVLPICLIISILRQRLWGIDFLINRSLVYGILSLLLVVVFGSILYIASFITQGQSSFLTFGMAAVVAGAVFQPTRITLQRFVDRRFYNISIDYQKHPEPKNVSQLIKQTRFGDYQELELLGRGGMAEVYKSIHPVLNIPVAIKLLPISLATNPEFRNRFVREAEIVTKLEHPNIIHIFDYGEQDDTHYMVMEYLAGKDLGVFLQSTGRLALAQALPFIQNIANALDYAHGIGLVHRDIKPSNILLDDTNHLVKLTDFGIAKLIGRTAMTRSGNMLGTFDYIAPEQIQASTNIDGRADIYAFGVMVYQMLTDELPFKHNNPGALLIAHLNEPPPDPRKIVPELPNNIARAIQRAMAKNPSERFVTAGEFAAELTKKEN